MLYSIYKVSCSVLQKLIIIPRVAEAHIHGAEHAIVVGGAGKITARAEGVHPRIAVHIRQCARMVADEGDGKTQIIVVVEAESRSSRDGCGRNIECSAVHRTIEWGVCSADMADGGREPDILAHLILGRKMTRNEACATIAILVGGITAIVDIIMGVEAEIGTEAETACG